MTEENQNSSLPEGQDEQQEDQKVFVGFHPFGGVKLQADNVRLSPSEAFILAGQLTAHATLMIQQNYMEQAMASRMLQEDPSKIILPGK